MKKALVLYHSSTGNTLAYAKATAEGLTQSGYAVELARFDRVDPAALPPADLLGFAAPAFQWKPPFHVEQFCRRLPALSSRPFFTLITYGVFASDALNYFAGLVTARDGRFVGGRAFVAEHSYPHLRLLGVDKKFLGRPNANDLAAAVQFGRKIAMHAADESHRVPPNKNTPSLSNTLSQLVPPRMMSWAMGPKRVDTNLCRQCGKCAEVCPLGSITLNPYPQFAAACEGCCGCFNNCPTGALTALFLRTKDKYRFASNGF